MNTKKLAAELVDILRTQGRRITTVESCTGGLIAGAITSVAGSSNVFDQGFVTYSNAAKTTMVDVPEHLLQAHGAVSFQVAASMAEGALKNAAADMALSVTGIAGPGGGSPEKPVGMVCFGLCHINPEREQVTLTQVVQYGDIGRDKVRECSVDHALAWALATLRT